MCVTRPKMMRKPQNVSDEYQRIPTTRMHCMAVFVMQMISHASHGNSHSSGLEKKRFRPTVERELSLPIATRTNQRYGKIWVALVGK